ncbi:hypothetical protein STCU_07205 [Strigomonas culicis]|uniref:Uncharacterized protein n=1 Tax=Strigomonas culicis TaxID=28005 RepID=S9U6H9_9TRYP|nr:hypothetical protein STCU_07205 [Strigomonas culicis]|eukprot:EPY24389.1 hypothetical protein STCU_07205 [Strigomonas culicis]
MSTFEEAIRNEDNARVRAIVTVGEREREKAELQARIERFRAAEREEAAGRQAAQAELLAEAERYDKWQKRKELSVSKSRSANRDRTAPVATRSRLNELSQPRVHDEPMYGAGTYGKCMHQRTNRVEFPQGRNGAPYTPGVDRDRIVPTSSSSTQHHHTPPRNVERDASIKEIARQHEASAGRQRHQDIEDAARRAALQQGDVTVDDSYGDEGSEDGCADRGHAPSVFSHASSNGPILATGVPHMGLASEKPTTLHHLQAYGGSVGVPRAAREDEEKLDDLSLPEVTTRLVRMQHSQKTRK